MINNKQANVGTFIPPGSPLKPFQRFPEVTSGTHEPDTGQESDIYLPGSDGLSSHCWKNGGEKITMGLRVVYIYEWMKLTDLKETFRLNGDTSRNLFKVEAHQA